jgi:membrane fusion protein (multidrug efflux system)
MIRLPFTLWGFRRCLQVTCLMAELTGGGIAMAQVTAVAPTSKPPIKIEVASSKSGQSESTNYPCMVQPSLEIDVGTPVDGVLEVVTVDRGDMVNTGKLLARLVAGVDEATVEHQTAKAKFASRKLERNQDLQKKQLISHQELDEIETDYRLAELELNQKREQLKLRSITSPIDGVIVDRYRNRGDLVKQEKIFRIARLNPLHVEGVVPASLFGRIRVGQRYQVALPLMGIKIMANVSNVDKVIDAGSGTFRVRLLLPNPKYELPSGLRCSINFLD